MSEVTDDVVTGAVVTGAVGLAYAAVKGLFKRNVEQVDARFESQDKRIEDLENRQRTHDSLLMELRGTVNSESWGLVAVVGKLSTNVEKLTSAVDRMDALVNDRLRD